VDFCDEAFYIGKRRLPQVVGIIVDLPTMVIDERFDGARRLQESLKRLPRANARIIRARRACALRRWDSGLRFNVLTMRFHRVRLMPALAIDPAWFSTYGGQQSAPGERLTGANLHGKGGNQGLT